MQDFSVDELHSATAECRRLLQGIRFGRFVPKRLTEESLVDYLRRYSKAIHDNVFDTEECYDYSEKFKEFEKYYIDNNTLANVESVQDMVINKIMECGKFKLAKEYITYRYQHELLRKGNSIDE